MSLLRILRNPGLAHDGQAGVLAVLLLAGVSFLPGCGLPKQWYSEAEKLPKATPDNPVIDMFCVWDIAEGQDPEGLPTRGFAGKITFFTRNVPTGVRVDGDVRIYVYDDQGPPDERNKPIHQWDFVGDAWKIHLQKSSLGPAYSVFIPYTRKGGRHANCALRVRLTPPNGAPIYSETVSVLMPGTKTKEAEAETAVPRHEPIQRSSLQSITIPLKEKQRFQFSQLNPGTMQMQHATAPVSELPPHEVIRSTSEEAQIRRALELARKNGMSNWPRQSPPVQQAQPAISYQPSYQPRQSPPASGVSSMPARTPESILAEQQAASAPAAAPPKRFNMRQPARPLPSVRSTANQLLEETTPFAGAYRPPSTSHPLQNHPLESEGR